jgi:hypothetical protein
MLPYCQCGFRPVAMEYFVDGPGIEKIAREANLM